MVRKSRWMLVVTLVGALVGAACGSGDDGDGDGSGEEGATVTTVAKEDIQANKAEGADTRTAAEEKPTPGGKLVYGIEADSANPWVHYATSCAISCRMIFRAISDPLFAPIKDGDGAKLVPFLLKDAKPSADYKTWTFTARDGIRFHDGTPFDGAAIAYNIDVCRLSGLTSTAYNLIDRTESSGMTATVHMKTPHVALPGLFRDEVCGMMFSPTWMRTLESNPLRKLDPSRVDPPTGKQAEPVGIGAFKYKSYTPGNGNSFVAVKNTDYWRRDQGLPYLDEIEFVVAVDIQGRSNGLRSNQFNIIHTSNADEGAKFQKEASKWALLQANQFGDTNHFMINVAQGENPAYAALTGKSPVMDPEGKNANSPLLNINCRRALAHGLDTQRLANEREAGLTKPANGPFAPGSLGYLEDSGYPKYDKAKAVAAMDTCLKELGKTSIEFTFNTTNDPFNVETVQLVVSMWKEIFGDKIKTTTTPIEQGQYIGLALAGTFNVFSWRNFGHLDPADLRHWWSLEASSPIGVSALNFGRFQDQVIADNYKIIIENPDPAKRREAAQAVNRRFGEQVYNLWGTWVLWTVAANPRVKNITDNPVPDRPNDKIVPVIWGKHHVAQIWCQEARCG